ncbi:hypothetical protein [Azospirillum soli]|uniref:hypothetical protein n=1 Tax=Azospirillum soli TaxID=1304799 RepID=UPI001FEAB48C|nr:hypothetical protein [Azospirillum soli]MBP2312739.1 hypothetical protein [Azospirillum soli]
MSSEHVLKLGKWDRPASLPDSLATELSGWRFVLRNPVAPSFYSKPGAPWDIPPEGCLRVSERWNTATEANATLFPTDQSIPDGHWALARFEASMWRVQSLVPADGRATVRELLRARADRLVNARRWTRSDLELLQVLQDGEVFALDDLLAGDEARGRSLRSLTKLQLAAEASGANPELPDASRRLLDSGKGPAVWTDAEAREVAATILDWHARKQARTAARAGRGAEARERGEALKDSVADAVRKIFPGIPKEIAAAVATRLAPSVGKLARMPGLQPIVDAVAEIRLERWRQAVASEPEVADRLLAMQKRGDPGRARKRYRDQRAVERVEAELRDWRGDLAPVSTRRLG